MSQSKSAEHKGSKKIKFVVPKLHGHLDARTSEHIRKRRPTPATLFHNEQFTQDERESEIAGEKGGHDREGPLGTYNPPSMRELQTLVELHIQATEEQGVEEDESSGMVEEKDEEGKAGLSCRIGPEVCVAMETGIGTIKQSEKPIDLSHQQQMERNECRGSATKVERQKEAKEEGVGRRETDLTHLGTSNILDPSGSAPKMESKRRVTWAEQPQSSTSTSQPSSSPTSPKAQDPITGTTTTFHARLQPPPGEQSTSPEPATEKLNRK
uniref:protein phosphatase 1 regulatory subunit 1B-like isoform X2 n=1 Tax=Myxine glutinosa TaxID=7769 RepID=UPI00358EC8A3